MTPPSSTRRPWLLHLALAVLAAGGPVVAAPAGGAVILDTTGFWRLHHTLRPPVVELDGRPRPIRVEQKWLNRQTPAAPANWDDPDFDDGGWLRGPARMACDSPWLARLCLRGKFTVTDPRPAGSLKLTVAYRGGAVVTVNGKEIARGHLPAGRLGGQTLAEAYPAEAFLGPDGKLLAWGRWWEKPPEEIARRLAIRTRTLADLPVPAGLLRKGVNVIGIEIVRAPYHEVMQKRRRDAGDRRSRRYGTLWQLNWVPCAIRRVQLQADGAAGLVPAAVRPKGFQVWNSPLVADDFDLDFGDPSEPPRPIRIVGTRNGAFSGKVVVGSDRPIAGLRASLAELKGPGGAIGPANIRIRYALPWGSQYQTNRRYVPAATPLGALAESPPRVVAVRAKTQRVRDPLRIPGAPDPVWGAVCGVWVTVRVPRTAPAGAYEGRLAVAAEGRPPVRVPVRLEVADWTLPDPQDYRTWIELTQSPDTLALQYGVDLWSKGHFELIGRSLEHFRGVGSRVVYLPLIAHTNLGNAESMVRWVPRRDGRYGHDFSVVEQYLDAAQKHMGRPKIVCLWVWDVALSDPDKSAIQPKVLQAALRALKGKGPLVTLRDPETGKTRNGHLPLYTDPKSQALWGPLFGELKKRLTRRGLWEAVMLGVASDAVPRVEEVEFFRWLAPGAPWVVHSHGGSWSRAMFKNTRVGYYSKVMARFADDPADGRRHGWRRPDLVAQLIRHWTGTIDSYPASTWRHIGEINVTGDQRGVGRLGGDFWPVLPDKTGHPAGRAYVRYDECRWRANDICTSLLAPGPTGPVATSRLEVMREGVQECEARIFIERALLDEKRKAALGDDLAGRCRQMLDERVRVMLRAVSSLQLTGRRRNYATVGTNWWDCPGVAGQAWFVATAWQNRSAKLYSTAGKVAEALKR